jgi:predicted secreted hydrolase
LGAFLEGTATAGRMQCVLFRLANQNTSTETWLNSTVTNSEIAIEDYKIYRLDRLHKRGGGVCAYIKKNLKASVLKELSQISESSFHQLWITISKVKRIDPL